jgi:predicted ATPase
MYLKQLYIENNGPLEKVHLELSFTSEGTPKPVVVVGGNGSGKTNLLSIIADALIAAAANCYTDVLPRMSATNKPFFRIVGARTIRTGTPGSFTVMEFEHEGTTHRFSEKGGRVPSAEARARLPESLQRAVIWGDDDNNVKQFRIQRQQADQIFRQGVYAYFPSSRAEAPHWLNTETIAAAEFDLQLRFTGRLSQPIYVEKALERLQQWILSVILESRSDFRVVDDAQRPNLAFVGDIGRSIRSKGVLQLANNILRQILGDTQARFVWLGRSHPEKLGFATSSGTIPSLGGLSAGQSTLLSIFATILYYGDERGFSHDQISGICLVDEIDAHMHVDLQLRALPELIRLFPKVQFIVSSHSPLFVLGMENAFGPDGMAIIDMPSGTPIQAEAYAEFAHALQVFQDTKAFAAKIEAAAAAPGKAMVFLEGETDPVYLNTATELLERQDLLEKVEFEWVGIKGRKGAETSGKDALNDTLKVLRRKPHIVQRQVILLYDHDAKKPTADYDDERIHVRTMPFNAQNTEETRYRESPAPWCYPSRNV